MYDSDINSRVLFTVRKHCLSVPETLRLFRKGTVPETLRLFWKGSVRGRVGGREGERLMD